MNIALIGPRGSGKSRVSQHLTRLLTWPVFSLDSLISYEEGGMSIPDLVEHHGGDWRYFRDLEYRVLAKTAAMTNVIIDCGGGIVVDLDEDGEEIYSERKAAILRERAVVFFLDAPKKTVLPRIAGDGSRPSLSAIHGAEEIYKRRLPMYRRVAHHEIPTLRGERKTSAHAVLDILAAEHHTPEIARAVKRARND